MDLLIVGGNSDPNTRRVVDQAMQMGIEFLFWDTDQAGCLDIAWDFESPELDLGVNRIQPKAIFARWNVFDGDSQVNLAVYETILAYLFAWPQVQMLNRFSINDSNNKSFNLRLGLQVGFEIPESIVMSNLQPLTSMPSPESRIAKPLGGGAHTRCVADLAQDAAALALPTPQFIQTKLPGENLRLFSIGGQLTCFHLVTSMLDYREDQQVEVVQVDVPSELVEPTRRLVARKKFDYCALDFRCRKLGTRSSPFPEPVFLEVNSFPMFVRFDDAGQNCLAAAILRTLKCQTSIRA